MWVPRCTVCPADGPWRAWSGGPFRLRDDEVWRPGERGRAQPRTGDGEAIALANDGLRWRCVFATTRTVSANEGPMCTVGCAFQIDIHCADAPQTGLVDDPAVPWQPIAGGRYRTVPGDYASIDIIAHDDRCWIQVDQLTTRDATASATAVAELVIHTIH
jgi:hypothetical protein